MKDRYFEIYKISTNRAGIILRVILFFGTFLILNLAFVSNFDAIKVGAIFSLVVINEIFLTQLSKKRPRFQIKQNSQNMEASMILSARAIFEKSRDSYEVVKHCAGNRAVKFFMDELGLKIPGIAQIQKDELLKQASETTSYVKGDYITEVDLVSSYFVLSEDTSHFLLSKELNNDDVINILYWTRKKFQPDNLTSLPSIRLLGSGVFDSLVFGWNYELKKYSKDLTAQVLASRFAPTIPGREKEFEELLTSLSKEKSSNAIIIGNPGTGKTTLVEYLATGSFLGLAPQKLSHKRIYELLIDKLLSGVSNVGELTQRLSNMLSDIAHSQNAIVLIQNIENIFGGGGFDFDISGTLYEYLKSEKIKIIGTTTPQGFASFIENKTSIRDLFEKVELEDLPEGPTLLLLTEKAQELAAKYNVSIRYSALKQSVLLASIYFPDKSFPGAAVDLLENVATQAKIKQDKLIESDDVISLVEGKRDIKLATPGKEEKEMLLHLEEKIHARVIGQDEAVRAVSDAMRRVRSGFENKDRPIAVFLFLGPTGVGKTETAKALAVEYFGSKNSMVRLDMSEYQTQDQIRRILGEKPGEEYIPNTLGDLVEKQPFSLILLDEFEKAHPHLLDLFLQVFDEGRLTDNRGKTISFKNAIIIATSNAGTELIREREDGSGVITKEELIDQLLENNLFKPELINRFDEIVLFKSLTMDEVKQIAKLILAESAKKLEDNQIKVSFDYKLSSMVAEQAYNPEFGARNIRRYIEENVEGYLSKLILEDKIKKGDRVTLSVDESNNWILDNRS